MIAARERIRAAFDQAEGYDRHAIVQRRAAGLVANRVVAVAPDGPVRVLEIGCGTGFLAMAVGDRLPNADWLMTDIAPAMVARSRRRLGADPRFRFAVLDGEHPCLPEGEAPFDLVCANLAMQWFEDLERGLAGLFRLLRPGGHLIFSTLADGTFEEWRKAHAELGLTPGTPAYPSLAALEALALDGTEGKIENAAFVERYEGGADFLRTIRSIGAGTPVAGHRPLTAPALRKVMRRFEQRGARASYRIALCSFQRPDPQ